VFRLYRAFSRVGLFMFRHIVYNPLWDIFVVKFEYMKIWIFLSSLEVLLWTTDPYLWISDSKWQIFLTYLRISTKWCGFLLFNISIDLTSPLFPFVDFCFTVPKAETILHHLVSEHYNSIYTFGDTFDVASHAELRLEQFGLLC